LAPVRRIVWDKEDYSGGHPYQFDLNFTPLRLTALAPEGRACSRTEFEPYSEIDDLLNSSKEEIMREEPEEDSISLGPNWWTNWWNRKMK